MAGPECRVVTPALLREWPPPPPGSGKEQRGSVVVVGGSRGTPGAVRLAGEAALRAGAGKLVLASAAEAASALGVHVPEAMVVALPAAEDGEIDPEAVHEALREVVPGAGAVVVGPGLGDPEDAERLVDRLVPLLDGPLVIDAVASAYLGGPRTIPGSGVLTVNPHELARTAGVGDDEVEDDPVSVARDLARRSAAVVLCGGTAKHVVAPDGRAWVVEGGGPGLGVSGSGDVQAGLVGGLLARGLEDAQAAVWGAYLHARAGERLAAAVSTVGYLARELPSEVPHVLAELRDG